MNKKMRVMFIGLFLMLFSINNVVGLIYINKPIDVAENRVEYWGLLIAVGEYLNNPQQNRPKMLSEVEELYNQLICSMNWDAAHLRKIKLEETTMEGIINGLKWLDSVEDSNDISLVYITTHGFPLKYDIPPFDEDDGTDEALIPYEGFDDTSKYIWDDLLNYYLSLLESQAICLIVDSCFAGGFNDKSKQTIVKTSCNTNDYLNKFNIEFSRELNGKGRIILMASEEDEVSYGCHFSHFINIGLSGFADTNYDNIITAEEIFYFAQDKVIDFGLQHPTILDGYEGELQIAGDINVLFDNSYYNDFSSRILHRFKSIFTLINNSNL